MYKIMISIIVVLLAALPLTAQEVNLEELDTANIDLSKVDISEAEFYFNGPVELFVDGLKYAGRNYAAELDYDGGNTIEVRKPRVFSTEMRPQVVDLSSVRLRGAPDGLMVENVIVEGIRYSGKVVYGDDNLIRVASYEIEGRVEEVEDRLAEYRREVLDKERQIKQLEQEIGDSHSEVREKERKIAQLERKINQIQRPDDLLEQIYPRTIVRGLVKPNESHGNWIVSSGMLRQTNRGENFAKYLATQNQRPDKLKYSFSGRVVGKGWRGFGLHFLANNIKSMNTYGLGESYLVWVTRDPGNMQTDKTYIQLYKSFNDIKMIELKSTITEIDISRDVDVDVFVDKTRRSITVAANDEVMFTFNDDSFISSGNSLAVRALGEVRFENFILKAK